MTKIPWKFPFLGRRETLYVPSRLSETEINENREVVQILEYLADATEITYDHSVIQKALSDFRYHNPRSQFTSIFEFLEETASIFGLKIHRIRRNLKSLKENVSSNSPWLCLVPSRSIEGKMEWISVKAYRGGKYKVIFINDEDIEIWFLEKDLLKLINIQSAEQMVSWIISEPLFPMGSVISSEENHSYKHHKNKHSNYDDKPNPIERIYSLLRVERRDIWIIIIYGIAVGILSLVVPIATSSLVNIVAFGVMLQPVLVLTFLVFLFLSFAGLMQAIQTYIAEILQRRLFVRVSTDFAARFPSVREEALDGEHPPEVVNRFFDTMTVQKAAISLLVEGLQVLLTTLIGLLVIAFYHPFFLVFSIVLVGAGYFLVIKQLGRHAVDTAIKVSKEKYYVAAWLQEIARHRHTFKSRFGSFFATEKSDTLTRSYLSAQKKHFRYLFRQIIGLLGLQAIASAFVLGLGGYLVINRQLTIGQLVAAELIVAKVLDGLGKFGKHLETFYNFVAALDKIGFVTDLPLEETKLGVLEKQTDPIDVTLTDVHYESLIEGDLFEKLDFHIPAGKKVVITGGSATESSILLDLIGGYRAPKYGIVEMSGEDIREICKPELRSHICLIRELEIFEGTILENLRVGRAEISTTRILEILEIVGLSKVVNGLPNGIHTNLSTYGSPLDSIQARQLLIARALLGSPSLILIDETLDGLDPFSLKKNLDALFDSNAQWTMVVVSYSPHIIERAEEFYVIEEGKIIRTATTKYLNDIRNKNSGRTKSKVKK
ncbi:peptidase domain-containing ABC transporter [Leptospira sp. GIMC2001]|uniref:peptidase domain-containing ABC transporter n=1 Tax=Leptospira sp. GIMC2001 TaxID=1513297 RepID=UPI00234AA336|nr:ABC transporter ATP-binding protein [Leptospira sp. GIMC2001]WCL49597.1 ABC transporter ATP-binding protein [Leptospira sp. GIMC2001]